MKRTIFALALIFLVSCADPAPTPTPAPTPAQPAGTESAATKAALAVQVAAKTAADTATAAAATAKTAYDTAVTEKTTADGAVTTKTAPFDSATAALNTAVADLKTKSDAVAPALAAKAAALVTKATDVAVDACVVATAGLNTAWKTAVVFDVTNGGPYMTKEAALTVSLATFNDADAGSKGVGTLLTAQKTVYDQAISDNKDPADANSPKDFKAWGAVGDAGSWAALVCPTASATGVDMSVTCTKEKMLDFHNLMNTFNTNLKPFNQNAGKMAAVNLMKTQVDTTAPLVAKVTLLVTYVKTTLPGLVAQYNAEVLKLETLVKKMQTDQAAAVGAATTAKGLADTAKTNADTKVTQDDGALTTKTQAAGAAKTEMDTAVTAAGTKKGDADTKGAASLAADALVVTKLNAWDAAKLVVVNADKAKVTAQALVTANVAADKVQAEKEEADKKATAAAQAAAEAAKKKAAGSSSIVFSLISGLSMLIVYKKM